MAAVEGDDAKADAALHLLFTEVNAHLRATETKQLEISIGYFALLAVSLSILASDEGLASADWAHATVYAMLVVIGCLVVYVQDSYRFWKMHYRLLCRRMASQLPLDRRFLPHWISRAPYEAPTPLRLSPDNALTYAAAASTVALVAMFDVLLGRLIDSGSAAAACIATATGLYVAFLGYVRGKGFRRVSRFRSETEEDARRGHAP